MITVTITVIGIETHQTTAQTGITTETITARIGTVVMITATTTEAGALTNVTITVATEGLNNRHNRDVAKDDHQMITAATEGLNNQRNRDVAKEDLQMITAAAVETITALILPAMLPAGGA